MSTVNILNISKKKKITYLSIIKKKNFMHVLILGQTTNITKRIFRNNK